MAKKKPKKAKAADKPAKRPRASAILTERRVGELVRIRLDGAERWDVLEYVREKEQEAGSAWEIPEGANPLSEGTIWALLTKADAVIHDSHTRSRKKLFRRHLAQRRNLYAKALLAGDVRTAAAVLKDEADLLGLYPARRTELTGKNGKPLQANVTHEHKDQVPPLEAVRILLASLARQSGGGDPQQVHSNGLPKPVDTAQPPPQAGRVPPP